MNIFKRTPLVSVGLALGLAALGNLLVSYGQWIRSVAGTLSAIIIVFVTIKILFNFDDFKEEMNVPVVASVFPAYSMTLMLLATYLHPIIGMGGARALWYFAIALHIVLMIWFTFKFAIERDIQLVYPSWAIVYVGIVVASVTAPVFQEKIIGQAAFWVGLVALIILLPMMFYRVYGVGNLATPTRPNVAILCAPTSLLLAGYINSFDTKNTVLLFTLLIISQLIYFFIVLQLPKLMTDTFLPSYSAFTFPLVISALSLKLTNGYLTEAGTSLGFLGILVRIEELIALVAVLVVLFGYLSLQFRATEETV